MTSSIEDRHLILEAINKYAHGYDEADFVLLSEAFSEDATSRGKISNSEMHWGPMIGRAQIVSGLQTMRMAPNQPRHCISNPLFTALSESAASLRCYLTLIGSQDQTTGILSVGTLQVEAQKQSGKWRICQLDVTLDAPF